MPSSKKFYELLSHLADLTDKQTFEVILSLRELGAGDLDVTKETIACFNSLKEHELIIVLRTVKEQFSNEDWETILDII